MHLSVSPALPSSESSPALPDSSPANTAARDEPTRSTADLDMYSEHRIPGFATETPNRPRNPVDQCEANRVQTEELYNKQTSVHSAESPRRRSCAAPVQEYDCMPSAGPGLFLFVHQINLPQAIVALTEPS